MSYITTTDKLKETIDTYGVAIIENVLDLDECAEYNEKTFEMLNEITCKRFVYDDINTWNNFYDLFPKHNMLLQNYVGHAQYIWNIRQNPKIVDIFGEFWNVNNDDLLVSFDGISFNLPPEKTGKGWRERAKKWLHCDQSFQNSEFETLQSWITFNNVRKGDATLLFLEGSNKYHNEFKEYLTTLNNCNEFKEYLTPLNNCSEFKEHAKNSIDKDWYKLDDEELQFYKDKGCEEKYIECKAGSLVLWDSRTIHCGIEPTKSRSVENLRNIVYLCYAPRYLCAEKELNRRRKAFNEGRMMSHCPYKASLFPKTPRTYGKETLPIKNLNKPTLTSLGEKLVGF